MTSTITARTSVRVRRPAPTSRLLRAAAAVLVTLTVAVGGWLAAWYLQTARLAVYEAGCQGAQHATVLSIPHGWNCPQSPAALPPSRPAGTVGVL